MLYACLRSNSPNSNFVVTTGKVINLETFPQNPEVFVTFRYHLSDRILVDNNVIPFSDKIKLRSLNKLLLGQELPVMYGKNDPWNCRMLFSEKDFKQYAITPTEKQSWMVARLDSINQD